jgi:predicted nucleotidyltransferase
VDLARPLALITPTIDADVLAVLAGARASFTGRQVHQVAGRHSERGVRNTLHRLSEQGIVTRERVGNADLYQLNRLHLAAAHIEAIVKLRSELLDRIGEEIGLWTIRAEFAALFGSAAKGSMRPDSDIDVFVVRPDDVDEDTELWQLQVATLTRHVTEWTGNDTRALDLAAAEVRDGLAAGRRVLQEIRDTGITLHGSRSYLKSKTQGRPRKDPND